MKQIEIREITDKTDIQKVVSFQTTIWGDKNTTPFPFLVASLHNGGVIIGAFNNEDLIGFCYGFPGIDQGIDQGDRFLVSHMMAVKEEVRNDGLGYKMKWKQREWALKHGYTKIVWTFDPLESRNAYLNICKLGGFIQTYYPDHYGEMEDELNEGLPTDRFLLEWNLTKQILDSTTSSNQIK